MASGRARKEIHSRPSCSRVPYRNRRLDDTPYVAWLLDGSLRTVPAVSKTVASTLRRRLAKSLRAHRTRHEWSQEQAAEAAEMNPRHYQKLEEGSVNATLRTLERLCGAYRIDVKRLF